MEKIDYRKLDASSYHTPNSALGVLLKIDPEAILEFYRDSETNIYWDITTKRDLIDQIKIALSDDAKNLGVKLQFVTFLQISSECVTCNIATASVGNQCKFCAGQL